MIKTLLQSATFAIIRGDNSAALSYLSEARALARQGGTQAHRAIATHCTVAMQNLLPEALEDYILSAECDDLFRPVSLEGML